MMKLLTVIAICVTTSSLAMMTPPSIAGEWNAADFKAHNLMTPQEIDEHQNKSYRKTAMVYKYNPDLLEKSDFLARGWATINDYQAYKTASNNEFDWADMRQRILKKTPEQLAYVSTTFMHAFKITLGEYDSARGGFPISIERAKGPGPKRLRGGHLDTNSGIVRHVKKNDPGRSFSIQSHFIWINLDQPISIDFLKMSRDEARGIIEQMQKTRNRHRVLYLQTQYNVMDVDVKMPKRLLDEAKINFKGNVEMIRIIDKKSNVIANIFPGPKIALSGE